MTISMRAHRGNAIINETRLSEETLEKLYPESPILPWQTLSISLLMRDSTHTRPTHSLDYPVIALGIPEFTKD
jgi:hypothetical protein